MKERAKITRILRKYHSFNIAEIEQAAGIPATTLNQVISGSRQIPLEKLPKLIEVMKDKKLI